jgi:hypothetical protein
MHRTSPLTHFPIYKFQSFIIRLIKLQTSYRIITSSVDSSAAEEATTATILAVAGSIGPAYATSAPPGNEYNRANATPDDIDSERTAESDADRSIFLFPISSRSHLILVDSIPRTMLGNKPPLTNQITPTTPSSPSHPRLKTPLASLTALLHGGLIPSQITELHGPAGSGKTQFALSLLISSVDLSSAGDAVYISTNRSVPVARLQAMAAYRGIDVGLFMERVLISHVYSPATRKL